MPWNERMKMYVKLNFVSRFLDDDNFVILYTELPVIRLLSAIKTMI